MARPRTLTDAQRLKSNAERQRRWRQRNRGLAKLKVKNWHAEQKAALIAEVTTPAPATPKTRLPTLPHYGEIHYGPVEGVDTVSQPNQSPIPAPSIQPAQTIEPTPEPTAEESRVAAKLAQMIQRKLDDDLDFKA